MAQLISSKKMNQGIRSVWPFYFSECRKNWQKHSEYRKTMYFWLEKTRQSHKTPGDYWTFCGKFQHSMENFQVYILSYKCIEYISAYFPVYLSPIITFRYNCLSPCAICFCVNVPQSYIIQFPHIQLVQVWNSDKSKEQSYQPKHSRAEYPSHVQRLHTCKCICCPGL